MKKFILMLSYLPLLSGCGVRQEYIRMRDQLDYLEASQRKTEARLAVMDSLLRIQTEVTYQLNAEMRSRWSSINERILSLDQQYQDQRSRAPVEDLPLSPAKPEPGKAVKPPSPPEKPREGPPAPDPKQLYDTAYLDITRGNYQLAIAGFREFLRLYPGSSLADNSQYWIGEAYYAQRNYSEALSEFDKVIENYPGQDKAAAAYYKSGLCLREMGDRPGAMKKWQELILKYPNSPEAKLAQDHIKE